MKPAHARKPDAPHGDAFSFRAGKDGRVFLSWHGKQVMVLKDRAAQKFLTRLRGLDQSQAQLLMAKTTGNFKRGNERQAANKKGPEG